MTSFPRSNVGIDRSIVLSEQDKDSLRRFLDGDESGFVELFDRHQEGIFRFLNGMLRNQESAEELTQDVFMRYLNSLDRVDLRYAPATLLYRIARNLGINRLKSASRRLTSAVAPEIIERTCPVGEEQSGILLRKEVGVVLERAIAALKPDYRNVLQLKMQEAKTFAEISVICGRSLRTVKRYMANALEQLEQDLIGAGFSLDDVL